MDLATLKYFEKGFDQADEYPSMLGIDVFLVNFTSKSRNPQLPPSRSGKEHPDLNVHFINVLCDDESKAFQFYQHGMKAKDVRAICE